MKIKSSSTKNINWKYYYYHLTYNVENYYHAISREFQHYIILGGKGGDNNALSYIAHHCWWVLYQMTFPSKTGSLVFLKVGGVGLFQKKTDIRILP